MNSVNTLSLEPFLVLILLELTHWLGPTVKQVTIRVVSQLLLQLHPSLLQVVQQLLQLRHLLIDVFCWDVLVWLHLRGNTSGISKYCWGEIKSQVISFVFLPCVWWEGSRGQGLGVWQGEGPLAASYLIWKGRGRLFCWRGSPCSPAKEAKAP